MSRGYIYGAATDITNVPTITENDFYDRAGYEASYFSNEEPSEIVNITAYLEEKKTLYGAEVGVEVVNGVSVPYIVFTDNVKANFFYKRFEKLQERVAELTLSEFATNVSDIKYLIDNTYSDCIYYEGVLYTEDSFIRNAVCGMRYYFSENIVCMH